MVDLHEGRYIMQKASGYTSVSIVLNCNLFWNNKGWDVRWHFFRTSVIDKLKDYDGDSEVLHRILNQKNNLPFINYMYVKYSYYKGEGLF